MNEIYYTYTSAALLAAWLGFGLAVGLLGCLAAAAARYILCVLLLVLLASVCLHVCNVLTFSKVQQRCQRLICRNENSDAIIYLIGLQIKVQFCTASTQSTVEFCIVLILIEVWSRVQVYLPSVI